MLIIFYPKILFLSSPLDFFLLYLQKYQSQKAKTAILFWLKQKIRPFNLAIKSGRAAYTTADYC